MSHSQSTTSTPSSLAYEPAARSSLARWSATKTVIGSATSAARRGSSSSSRSRSAEGSRRPPSWMRLRARARRRSGSSPWSNSRLDLVQVLAPVVGAHLVERTRFIKPGEQLVLQRRDELVGLLRDAHRQLGHSARRNRVDQRTRGVVDPVHVPGLVLGRRERLAAMQLAGEVERQAVPERDVAKHTGHAPVLVDHLAELPVAQTRNQRPHPLELTRIRRNEGAIHDDQSMVGAGSAVFARQIITDVLAVDGLGWPQGYRAPKQPAPDPSSSALYIQ